MIAVYDIEVQADYAAEFHAYEESMWAKLRASQAGEITLTADEEQELAVFLCGVFGRDD